MFVCVCVFVSALTTATQFRAEIQQVIDHAGDDLHWVVQYANDVYGYDIGNDVIAQAVGIVFAYSFGFRLLAYVVFHLRLWKIK